MDEQQFLNEINAIPWEQPSRNDDYRNSLLVFADWLEERGDPRSELIRLREGLLNNPTPEQRQLWEPRMQALIPEGVQPIVATWQNSISMKFCWCPPGKFMMGSPETEVDRHDGKWQIEGCGSRRLPISSRECELIGRGEVLPVVDGAGTSSGSVADGLGISAADGSPVEICLSCRDHDYHGVWGVFKQ